MPPQFDLFITSPRLSAGNPPQSPTAHPGDTITVTFTADPPPTNGSRRVWAWLLNSPCLLSPTTLAFLDFSPATGTPTSQPSVPTMMTPGPCLLLVMGEWFSDNYVTLVGKKSDQVVINVTMGGGMSPGQLVHQGTQDVVLGEFVFRGRQS